MSPTIPDYGADTNKLTKAPAGVDIRSQVATEGDRADFRCIRDRNSLEDTPRYATQDLGDLEVDDILRREEYSHKTREQRQASDDGVAVPKPLRYVAIDRQADDLAL